MGPTSASDHGFIKAFRVQILGLISMRKRTLEYLELGCLRLMCFYQQFPKQICEQHIYTYICIYGKRAPVIYGLYKASASSIFRIHLCRSRCCSLLGAKCPEMLSRRLGYSSSFFLGFWLPSPRQLYSPTAVEDAAVAFSPVAKEKSQTDVESFCWLKLSRADRT